MAVITDQIEAGLRRVAPEARCSRLPSTADKIEAAFQFGWPVDGTYFTTGEFLVTWFDYTDGEGDKVWTPRAGWRPYISAPIAWWDRSTMEALDNVLAMIEEWFFNEHETPDAAARITDAPPDDWNNDRNEQG